ncbi:iron-containing redox enzyme family protein [Candidatus Albibeggiatoa sp. nov. BB20]|uniref:iron-containing redox enzyme family protein n=1 Tax=Candidatus Albibeggiatoa sp. nov. BB20 TaxID=3162723 RepID=UPI0033654A17
MTNLIQPVRESYAHNSRLYDFMEHKADLNQIVEFLTWDAEQPAFYVYLGHWENKVPELIHSALVEHIAEEKDGDHSGMFIRMFEDLQIQAGNPSVNIDPEQLERLNYLFSANSAEEQGLGFFLGGFLATEFMSQKRCEQLWNGLRRLEIQTDYEYLELHAVADAHHWVEVDEKMIEPALKDNLVSVDAIQVGINHRLQTSANFLKFYENEYLF